MQRQKQKINDKEESKKAGEMRSDEKNRTDERRPNRNKEIRQEI